MIIFLRVLTIVVAKGVAFERSGLALRENRRLVIDEHVEFEE